MLSRLLREFLFTLIHLFVTVIVAVQHVYHRFREKKSNNYLYNDLVTEDTIRIILEHVPRMNKKPNHLVVLTNTDYHTTSDLARLVIWSLVAGLPYVSFYDITGKLKENEEFFFYEVEKNKKGIPGCIKWCNKIEVNGYTYGAAHTLTVNIFNRNDGAKTIAQCLQQIVQEKVPIKNDFSEFTPQELNETLSVFYPNIPDPDLVLYSGSLCCTFGLLPWHIRLTEFIQISLGYKLYLKDYIDSLYKYNKCNQRFGK